MGSMARHISDLSDPDANWFVLLGGQDGWFGSESFADQVELWRERRYIRLPLSPEKVREEFPTVMRLGPAL
jgi:penicillin amidase